MEEREVIKVRQTDEAKREQAHQQKQKTPSKSRKKFAFSEKNVSNLDALGMEEFQFYKEL